MIINNRPTGLLKRMMNDLHIDSGRLTILEAGLELSLRLIRDLPQELHLTLFISQMPLISLSRAWLDFPSPVELCMTDGDDDCMSAGLEYPRCPISPESWKICVANQQYNVCGDVKWTVPEITAALWRLYSLIIRYLSRSLTRIITDAEAIIFRCFH